MRWRRRWRWLAFVAIARTAGAEANADAEEDVALARFHGGRFGRELCAGVLITPSVVLTTAHCALSPYLAAVNVSSASASVALTSSVATREAKKQNIVPHPQFGKTHAFANNVALIFLDDDTQSSSGDRWRLASLPTNSSEFPNDTQQIPAAGAHLQELQVGPDGVAWASRSDFSQSSCADSLDFSGDASVWCSQQQTIEGKHLEGLSASSSSSSSDCADGSIESALGSPTVTRTTNQDGSERLVVVGLRLTDSCAEDQAFVYIPSVLDFIHTHIDLTPASTSRSSSEPVQSLLGFGFDNLATTVGKVSLGDQSSATDTDDTLSPSNSSASSSSTSVDGEIVFPDDRLGSGFDSEDAGGSSESVLSNFVGGWTKLPSLGDYSSFAALVVQNTTEELGELQGCLGILIAPKYLIADGQCMAFILDPQVVVSIADGSSNATPQSYSVANIVQHQDYDTALVILELTQPIAEMTPITISRSVSKQYQVTDENWELVSMDNLFASQRTDQGVVVKKSIVRLPPTSCNVLNYSAVPFVLCLALGSDRDRQDVVGFSQGLILHDNKLVALPQCYSTICPGGLFHDAALLAAKEAWIRNETRDTVLWDLEPLDAANLSDDEVSADGDSMPPLMSTFAVLVGGASNATELCNGVLIAPKFVLTSASCVVNATVSLVRLGLDQLVSNSKIEDTISVRNVHIHPEYAISNAANDLALVELGGMSYFAPTMLAWDDKLVQQPLVETVDNSRTNGDNSTISSTNSGSDDSSSEFMVVEVDTLLLADTPEVPMYSWPISVSSLDCTILCTSETAQTKSSKQSTASSSTSTSISSSSSGEALSDDIFQCSLLKPASGRSASGSGLVAALNDGSTLLGIATSACSNSDTCPTEVGSSTPDTSCYARIATERSKDFINKVSVGHGWQGKSRKSITMNVEDSNAKVIPADDPGYTGSLVYDAMPADIQVGFVVGLRKDKSGQNFCGGSLIAPSYVLTAAHCVLGGEAKYVSVGSRASSGTETELIGIKKNKLIVHPMYGKQSSISYDVAVIELEVQAYPEPIQLDNALNFDASTEFTLYGYGAGSAKSTSLSPVMRSVDLPFYNRTSCHKYYPELDESMLCAGGEPARDACTGDSGSPLVYYQNGIPVLVGVVSTGRNGCGTPGVPGIYGYVSSMQAFVNSYVAGTTWLDPNKAVGSLQTKMTTSSQQSTTSPSSPSNELRTSLNETEGDDGVPFEIIHSATDEHQLSVVKLAADTPELLQDALMEYLLGGYTNIGGIWSRKSAEIKGTTTSITFYSSGDMAGLMETIAEHRARPLYQRTSRFGKRDDNDTELLSSCCHG